MKPTLLLVATLAAGCGRDSTDPGDTCPPAADVGSIEVASLGGAFDVQLVAESGAMRGTRVRGRLALRPQSAGLVSIVQPDTGVSVTQPFIGTLHLALEEVGAVRMGDPASGDSAAPGVGIYVIRRGGGEMVGVVARIGSASNGRGLSPLDGGHFTIFIAHAGSAGISGPWRSSAGVVGLVGEDAAGRFCAVARP